MVKRPKDKNAPKRPLTGFLIYGNELRSKNDTIKSMPVTQQATAIGQLWKELGEKEKEKYNMQSEKLKEQYKKDLCVYEKSDSYKEYKKALKEGENGNGDEKKRKKKGPVKMSGYRLFMKENKDNIDEGLSEEDIAKKHITKCGIKWKLLSEEEREGYNQRAETMKPEGNTEDMQSSESK
ncbi:high mobility group box 3 [Glugoides intestinalis]